MSKLPKPLPREAYIAKHRAELVEMTRWPNGCVPSLGTPGVVMARFVGLGLATYRVEETRVGRELVFRLTDEGRRTAEVMARHVEARR